jgi:glucosyl-3-phosphoglycerate synthase
MRDDTLRRWLERRSYGPAPVAEVAAAKRGAGCSVAVVLPALDEAQTIGAICDTIDTELVPTGLVDRVVVVDSGSSDATPQIARAHGAEVHHADEILPELGTGGGKGDALYKGLAVADCDIVVFCDSDVSNFKPTFVSSLVAPLLIDPALVLTKAFYDRPLERAGELVEGGARVTELVVRPLINTFYPDLAGVVQPLAGEYAGRAAALEELPFFTGYGVEIGLLVDVVETYGLDALAQVDLGLRLHDNQDVPALGRMAFQVMSAFFKRLDELGRLKLLDDLPALMLQFTPDDELELVAHHLGVVERPPLKHVRGGRA